MRQTLFTIPAEWFTGPILIGWAVIGLLVFAWLVRKHGWKAEAFNFLPVYAVGLAVIYFIAPQIGITDIDPADPNGPDINVGLAVRGYGLMMILGIFGGVGLSMYLGRREGIHHEHILSLAIWMCICGIVGARAFYVIQKRDQFFDLPFPESLWQVLNMTQGGLVVYGSLIGATAGGLFFLWRNKLPILKVADVVAPGMLIGLCLGRIGCLLNGCCYGGVCEIPEIAQAFPAGSPPYLRQLDDGSLLGITQANPEYLQQQNIQKPDSPDLNRYAEQVQEGSLADQLAVEQGEWYRIAFPPDKPIENVLRAVKQKNLQMDQRIGLKHEQGMELIEIDDLPDHSIGVYPTQILASVNAAVLAILLIQFLPIRRRYGQAFGLLIILYSVTRYLLELVRADEYGQFGTEVTISQWVSICAIVGGFALFIWAPEPVQKSAASENRPPVVVTDQDDKP